MKTKTFNICLTTVFAAIYSIAVVSLSSISFQLFQVRVADALLPLSIIFGYPAIIGLTIGCLIANFFGGLGVIDVIGGSFANFIAAFIAWKIGKLKFNGSWILASLIETLVITGIVGFYLSFIFNVPLYASLLSILIGSLIAINLIGYFLLKAISRIAAKYIFEL
ncbi:MAG: QueT transporter family protein [Candidatus Bathyarchaeia archaeon]|nr:QueT transporter family protein [Candidatus Bathyarchaeota archaeon]